MKKERWGMYIITYDPKRFTPTYDIYRKLDGTIVARFAKPKGTLTVFPDKTKLFVKNGKF